MDYTDDGLGILRNISRPEAGRKHKSIIKISKECGLYYLWSKQKDSRFPRCSIQLYINIQSNHPPNIIADIPKAISKCLTNISCNKNFFDRNVDIYQAALKIVALM